MRRVQSLATRVIFRCLSLRLSVLALKSVRMAVQAKHDEEASLSSEIQPKLEGAG